MGVDCDLRLLYCFRGLFFLAVFGFIVYFLNGNCGNDLWFTHFGLSIAAVQLASVTLLPLIGFLERDII